MINKKSQSGHIEMILSFIIFIGFVLAIFIFINPLQQRTADYGIINDIQTAILENLSISYNQSSLILNEDSLDPCFSVDNNLNMNQNLIVLDQNGNPKKTQQSGKIYIENTPNNRYYRLYFSDVFNSNELSNTASCISLDAATYNFGILSTTSSVLYENILALNKSYMEDYESLKTNLGLKNDFDFIIYDGDKKPLFAETPSLHKLKNLNVFSREIPLRVIDKNAEFRDIILHLEAW